MPNPEIVYIQTEPEWLHPGNSAANDAALLSFEDWKDLWGWECNCVLAGQSCPACRGEARKPFGDSIPYRV